MTDLLRRAFEKAAEELPDYEQDELGRRLLELLETDDKRWEEAFARTGEQLDRLAARARDDIRAGRVRPLDPEKL
jgi:hypothetical protein